MLPSPLSMCSAIHCHHSFRPFRALSLNLIKCGRTHFKDCQSRCSLDSSVTFWMFPSRGPRKVRDFLGRGGGAATSTSLASSLSQATDDVERWQLVSENLINLLASNLVKKIYKISRAAPLRVGTINFLTA